MRKRLLPLSLYVFITVSADMCNDGSNGKVCLHDFQCQIGAMSHPLEDYTTLVDDKSIFNRPCKCEQGWNEGFCEQANSVLNVQLKSFIMMPTVCVCRKLMDEGKRCQQFLSRCYNRGENECQCCFNQPADHCSHIKCSQGEPVFTAANTSCLCFSSPSDYPVQICKGYIPRRQGTTVKVNVLGMDMSATIVLGIVVLLLVVVAVLATMILIAGNRRMRKRRERREVQRAKKRDALVSGREEDESFLPNP